MPSEATISAGVARPADSAFILVNSAGQILIGDGQAREFRLYEPSKHLRLTDVVPLTPNSVLATAQTGIVTEELPRADK